MDDVGQRCAGALGAGYPGKELGMGQMALRAVVVYVVTVFMVRLGQEDASWAKPRPSDVIPAGSRLDRQPRDHR